MTSRSEALALAAHIRQPGETHAEALKRAVEIITAKRKPSPKPKLTK